MEIEKLAFVAVHRLDAIPPWEKDKIWGELTPFDEADHPQLLASVFARAEPVLTADKLKGVKTVDLFVGPLEGIDDEAIERWDLVEPEEEERRYQLWLYHCNRGTLFEAGTTKAVGLIDHCIFRIVPGELDYWDGEDLIQMLRAAHRKAKPGAPDSELAYIEF